MKTKKWLFIVLGLIVIVTIVGYKYLYQSHRDIATEEAVFTITASELSQSFQENEALATQTYLNQTVLVEGVLTTIDTNTVMMGLGIFFALSENQTTFKNYIENTKIKIKGRCIGYDSLLEEVKFDQATVFTK